MFLEKNKDPKFNRRIACVILAGGQGTRLFPLTSNRCKPAVRFGGHYRLIDIPISNSLNSKISNIFIISQYFSSGLIQHIKDTYQIDHFQGGTLTLLNPEQRLDSHIWYSGTADAVRKNLNYLTEIPVDYFLILSGDQLYNMDLDAMVSFAREKDADLTIAALTVSKPEASRLGVLNIDDRGQIIDFYEKPKDPKILDHFQLSDAFINAQYIRDIKSPCFLASMGIYVFKKEVLIELLCQDLREDFGKHLIPYQLKKGTASAFLHRGYWQDIGTISSFYQANLALTDRSIGLDFYNGACPIHTQSHALPGAHLSKSQIIHSIICNGSIIEAKKILRSVVGIRSVVGSGTVIQDSILLGNADYKHHKQSDATSFHIGNNCTIRKAIIDENVTIGNHVQLVNQKKLSQYDGNGIFIRDNVIIVASNTKIPDCFVL